MTAQEQNPLTIDVNGHTGNVTMWWSTATPEQWAYTAEIDGPDDTPLRFSGYTGTVYHPAAALRAARDIRRKLA